MDTMWKAINSPATVRFTKKLAELLYVIAFGAYFAKPLNQVVMIDGVEIRRDIKLHHEVIALSSVGHGGFECRIALGW